MIAEENSLAKTPSAFARHPASISSLPRILTILFQTVVVAPATQHFPLPFAPELLQPEALAFVALLNLKASPAQENNPLSVTKDLQESMWGFLFTIYLKRQSLPSTSIESNFTVPTLTWRSVKRKLRKQKADMGSK